MKTTPAYDIFRLAFKLRIRSSLHQRLTKAWELGLPANMRTPADIAVTELLRNTQ